jgi:hypothetical protein
MFVYMDFQYRKAAASRTLQVLMVAFCAFLLGGYIEKGSSWPVLVLSSGVLVGALFMLIRDFWKPIA